MCPGLSQSRTIRLLMQGLELGKLDIKEGMLDINFTPTVPENLSDRTWEVKLLAQPA